MVAVLLHTVSNSEQILFYTSWQHLSFDNTDFYQSKVRSHCSSIWIPLVLSDVEVSFNLHVDH